MKNQKQAKRMAAAICMVLVLVVALAGCQAAQPAAPEQAAGPPQEMNVAKGSKEELGATVTIALESNPTTGYEWKIWGVAGRI